ncbi:hemolysin [Lysinibacillus sphaericus]|uniref:hemolysin n=1 Tax=Lysinibacillus sphaericus TaxID=1421 RepID=UPI000C188C08|nr:hemolysin [Lysinibacillus sphaericus]MDM5351657.1 hemolysin [Lysinibacillus sphaericus]PIJ95519.1 hemolysin [Lysinibacillus sphaericus]
MSGAKDRQGKIWGSLSDFVNYATFGFTGMVNGAVNPKDPLSKEHLLDSFGVVTSVFGVKGTTSKTPSGGQTKPAPNLAPKPNQNPKKQDETKGTGKAGQKVSESNSKVIEELEGPILDGKRVGSGEKVDKVKPVWGRDEKGKPIIEKEFPYAPKEQGFSDVVDNYSRFSEKFPLVGGDKIERELYQITGSNNGKKGVFEWIVEPNGDVSHRRFIEDGVITGKPNQVPKK